MNDQLLEAIRQRQATTEFGYGITTADRYAKNVLDAVGLEVAYKCAATRTISWDDVMRKAARTLVYSNPDMVLEEIEFSKRAGGSSLKKLDDVELPKNCLMVFRHVLTTPRKDRDGDVLRTQGAKVDPRMILLWNHVHTLPIGKMVAVAEHNPKKLSLVSCIVDMNDLSHDCAVMIDNGMGRFSHGFRAISFNKIKARDGVEGGFDVDDFEIMEESLVTVPSNTDAEVEEVMLGLVEGGKLTSPIMKEYGRTIRDHRPLQLKAGLDLSKIQLPIDLKITLNGKEIEHEDVKGAGAETGSGAEGEGKDAAGLAEKADGSTADKAEEAATDEEVKCPECGTMMSRAAGAECPKCGYVMKKGDEEDEEMEEEKSTTGTKFGRTFSRKNLTTLKEIHGDVEELDRGDHVLSVRGREITKGCRTKIKAMIDEHDIPDLEEGKSFEKANPQGINQYSGGRGGGGSSESGSGQARTAPLREVNSIASKHGLKKVSSGMDDEDMKLFEGSGNKKSAIENDLKTSGYKPVTPGTKTPISKAPGTHYSKQVSAAGSTMSVHAAVDFSDGKTSILFYGKGQVSKSFSVEDAMGVLIAEATPQQRMTIQKAFAAIEEVERRNARAKQYRLLIKGDTQGHPFRGNQFSGGGGGGTMAPDRDSGSGIASGGRSSNEIGKTLANSIGGKLVRVSEGVPNSSGTKKTPGTHIEVSHDNPSVAAGLAKDHMKPTCGSPVGGWTTRSGAEVRLNFRDENNKILAVTIRQ